MRGTIFRELIDMIEKNYSLELADRVISSSDLATGGAYTAVGTYDHREIIELVERLSHETGVPGKDLLYAFGQHLFKRFAILYPAFFAEQGSVFEFLSILDCKIHVEVTKLYPDAELPKFQHEFPTPDKMIFIYSSIRPFGDLAQGLIQGCINYFAADIALTREDLPCESGAHVCFTLTDLAYASHL
ncbi:MAG TPA: heme NO-binding domain-containing protein [Paucimonas sp.]|nr:heme NO-binding domain-containing protein [Paucimonas sp.]